MTSLYIPEDPFPSDEHREFRRFVTRTALACAVIFLLSYWGFSVAYA